MNVDRRCWREPSCAMEPLSNEVRQLCSFFLLQFLTIVRPQTQSCWPISRNRSSSVVTFTSFAASVSSTSPLHQPRSDEIADKCWRTSFAGCIVLFIRENVFEERVQKSRKDENTLWLRWYMYISSSSSSRRLRRFSLIYANLAQGSFWRTSIRTK